MKRQSGGYRQGFKWLVNKREDKKIAFLIYRPLLLFSL